MSVLFIVKRKGVDFLNWLFFFGVLFFYMNKIVYIYTITIIKTTTE